MPHDRDGKLLEVGDFVYIPCMVKSIQKGEDYCNIELESVELMPPENRYASGFNLNSKQVIKE